MTHAPTSSSYHYCAHSHRPVFLISPVSLFSIINAAKQIDDHKAQQATSQHPALVGLTEMQYVSAFFLMRTAGR
ncbi:hypothetical protein EON65_44225 [archaeon]|nr:MAG: hypothetical protein EON65_44225 [archaeon]